MLMSLGNDDTRMLGEKSILIYSFFTLFCVGSSDGDGAAVLLLLLLNLSKNNELSFCCQSSDWPTVWFFSDQGPWTSIVIFNPSLEQDQKTARNVTCASVSICHRVDKKKLLRIKYLRCKQVRQKHGRDTRPT